MVERPLQNRPLRNGWQRNGEAPTDPRWQGCQGWNGRAFELGRQQRLSRQCNARWVLRAEVGTVGNHHHAVLSDNMRAEGLRLNFTATAPVV
jgi:hypothetical protein